MEIIIRKIDRKGNDLVFKPNSKSGFRFTEDYAQPNLTLFQKSCIQVKPQKDRKLGSFWTPNFCYLGMLLVEHGEVSLLNVIEEKNIASTEVFNSHFPEKKWYWYNKTDEQNLAVQTYFMGVRAVASLLSYYYELQKTSKLKEADVLYKQYLKPLGVAKILSQVDSNLLTADDNIYSMKLTSDDCTVVSGNANTAQRKKNAVNTVNKNIDDNPRSQFRDESSKVSNNKNCSADNQPPKRLEIPKIGRLQAEDQKESADDAKNKSKRVLGRLPKIGEL